jgi:hypothetical protein
VPGDGVTLGWAQGAVHLFDAGGVRTEQDTSQHPVTMLA